MKTKTKYIPAPFNITAFAKEANRLSIEPKHVVIGRRGGKIPGKPASQRKYIKGSRRTMLTVAT